MNWSEQLSEVKREGACTLYQLSVVAWRGVRYIVSSWGSLWVWTGVGLSASLWPIWGLGALHIGGAAVDSVSGKEEVANFKWEHGEGSTVNVPSEGQKSNLPLKIPVPQWNLQNVGPPSHIQATPVLEELNSYVTLAQEFNWSSGVYCWRCYDLYLVVVIPHKVRWSEWTLPIISSGWGHHP